MATTSTPNLGLIKPDLQELIKAPPVGWAAQNAQNMDAIDNALRIIWNTYTPVWSANGTQPVIGTGGFVTGQYLELGKNFVSVWVQLDTGGTGFVAGTGDYFISLPFQGDRSLIAETIAGVMAVYDNNDAANSQLGSPVMSKFNDGNVEFYVDTVSFSWDSNDPFVLDQNDAMSMWLTYAREV